jgi:hypothetical protein
MSITKTKGKAMNSNRKIARIAGVLFIIGTVVSLLSTGFTKSLLDTSDYLMRMSANGNQIMIGALLALIAAVASAGIAISLYPVLKQYNEGLALGAVGFRLIEGVFQIVAVICLLLLLTLSQEFVKAGAPGASYFQTSGTLIRAVHDWSFYAFSVSVFSLGALMYYYVLYQSKLIPRWLAGWGFIGAALSLAASLFVMFGEKPLSILMTSLILPIAVQEMVMAVWLIVKGFNPSAITSTSAKIFNSSAIASESVE